jgi:hypothetical protein
MTKPSNGYRESTTNSFSFALGERKVRVTHSPPLPRRESGQVNRDAGVLNPAVFHHETLAAVFTSACGISV